MKAESKKSSKKRRSMSPPKSSRRPKRRKEEAANPTPLLLPDAKWNAMFAELRAFKKKHGNTLVPQRQKDCSTLSRWVVQQRQDYRRFVIRPDHLKRLQSINFTFGFRQGKPADVDGGSNPKYGACHSQSPKAGAEEQETLDGDQGSHCPKSAHRLKRRKEATHAGTAQQEAWDAAWDAMFAELIDYKKKHDNTLVPQRPSKLGGWVQTQRKLYRQRILRADRLKRLESINFAFDPTMGRPVTANGGGKLAKAISNSNAKDQETPVDDDDNQRSILENSGSDAAVERFAGENSGPGSDMPNDNNSGQQSTDERGARIMSTESAYYLASHILPPDPVWDDLFARLLAYKRKHGDTVIPVRHKDDAQLARFVRTQRQFHRQCLMRPDHLARLKSIDFAFGLDSTRKPISVPGGSDPKYDSYQQHVVSALEQEAEADMEFSEDESDDDDDKKMAVVKELASSESAAAIDVAQAGTDASVSVSARSTHASNDYEKMITKVKVCLPLPGDPDTMDKTQRKIHRRFLTMLERLKSYIKEHTHTMVPQHYAADEELGNWVIEQRKRLRARTLDQVQFQSLADLGFVWRLSKGRRPLPLELNFVEGTLPPLLQGAPTAGPQAHELQTSTPVPVGRQQRKRKADDGVAVRQNRGSPDDTAFITLLDNGSQVQLESKTTDEQDVGASCEPGILLEAPLVAAKSSHSIVGSPSHVSSPVADRSSLIRRPSNLEAAEPFNVKLLFPSKSMLASDYASLDALMAILFHNTHIDKFAGQSFTQQFPELASLHDQVVQEPMDLNAVMASVKDRSYQDCRAFLDDICRVFDQRLQVFSQAPAMDPNVPRIILEHLKNYFFMLWQEYMLPSDAPDDSSDAMYALFVERDRTRKDQLDSSAMLPLNKHILDHFCDKLSNFIVSGGSVDSMDSEQISSLGDTGDLETRLKELLSQLSELSRSNKLIDYTFQELHDDLLNGVPDASPHRQQLENRLSRFFWQLGTPINEANTRGRDASIIWADVADSLWARVGPRKPYWPALWLGVIATPDSMEPWQPLLNARNEARLPRSVAAKLATKRRQCEQAVQQADGSYWLVELLGSHEFRWIAPEHLYEFDESMNPNDALPARYRDVRHSKLLPQAIQEVNAVAVQYAQGP